MGWNPVGWNSSLFYLTDTKWVLVGRDSSGNHPLFTPWLYYERDWVWYSGLVFYRIVYYRNQEKVYIFKTWEFFCSLSILTIKVLWRLISDSAREGHIMSDSTLSLHIPLPWFLFFPMSVSVCVSVCLSESTRSLSAWYNVRLKFNGDYRPVRLLR